jgi:diketogulonate reductase-like aldo/keto reductase
MATEIALDVGFRHFDCAERYRNEVAVADAMGELVDEERIARRDVFITTKLWNCNHRPDRVRQALDASLNRLHIDYADLYLIHTPTAFKAGDDQDPRDANGALIYDRGVTLLDTWRAMERLVLQLECKAIGLANVSLEQLQAIYRAANVKPAVVQVESHPYLPQWDMLQYCKEKGIVMVAYSPLGHGLAPRLVDDPVILNIARRTNRTPAQTLIAWGIQRGAAVITGSTQTGHILENADISSLPQDCITEINEKITLRHSFFSQSEQTGRQRSPCRAS